MNYSTLLKKAFPHFIAIIVFFVLTIFYYSPMIFEGKILDQKDVKEGIGAGQEAIEFRKETGEEALWTNSMFSGMPAYLINTYWSGSGILKKIETIISGGLPSSAKETFLSMLCFYILLLTFGVRPYLAIAGGIAFGFSTFFIVSIKAGHIWKVRAIAYAPLVLAGVHLTYQKKIWTGVALTALALALEFNSNHLQITYYIFMLIAIYSLGELVYAIKQKQIAGFLISSGWFTLAILLAVGANLGKIWSTYEYGKYSIRGKAELSSNQESKGGLDRDYAFHWSSGKAETLTLLVPNFYGGASGVYLGKNSALAKAMSGNVPGQQIRNYERGYLGYWGPQPGTAGPAYAGAIVCFLFVLGMVFAPKKHRWWIGIATLIFILLSWGKNFAPLNYFLFDYLPFYNKFRAVTMTIVMALLAMPLLGFIGLEELLKKSWNKEVQKKFLLAVGITTGITLIIALVAYVPQVEGDAPDWFKAALNSSRKSIIRSDSFRSLFFILSSAILLFFTAKGKIGPVLGGAVLASLMALDLLGVSSRYLDADSYISKRNETFFAKTDADQSILEDTTKTYRVLNFNDPFNDARTSVFHKSIGGYHGAKMRRYQELIEHQISKEIQQISNDKVLNERNTRVISMLNTKYIVTGTESNAVFVNPLRNGPAWFVKSLIQVNNPDEEMDALNSLEVSTEAVIDVSKFDAPKFGYDSSATITIKSYAPNKIVYKTQSDKDGYAVFSEIYYPKGWKAFIDGNPVDIQRVNYVLRGMPIPAGAHEIEYRFQPKAYFVGNKVMWVANLLIILIIGFSFFRELRSGLNKP